MSANTDEVTKGSTTFDKVLEVNATDRNGDTPLHSIVAGVGNQWGRPQYNDEDDVKSIDLLLKCGIDVNAKNKDENTALHLAIIKGRAACILSKLLDANCNVNQKNKEGYTPLHLAVKSNLSFEHIKFLVDHGSDINLADKDGKTSFYYSVAPTYVHYSSFAENNLAFNFVSSEITEYLIQNEAKLDISSSTGYTPLLVAVLSRHTEALKLMMKHKFDEGHFNSVVPKEELSSGEYKAQRGYNYRWYFPAKQHSGRTALQVAINDKQVEIAKMLLQAGAPTETTDEYGNTALHMAISAEQPTIVEALLQAGASVNIPTASGETCLHMAVSRGQAAMVKDFVSAGISLNMHNKDQQTALHLATKVNDVKQRSAIAECLIKNGADLNAKDKYNKTALHMAISNERLTIVKALLQAGASVNIPTASGETCLHMAVSRGQAAMVKDLVSVGIFVNMPNNDQQTALHLVTKVNDDKQRSEITEYLIENGADLNAKDKNNETALHRAIEQERRDMIKMILSSAAKMKEEATKKTIKEP